MNSEAEQAFKRLGDFEILRELGRGGMGVVYEAKQLSLGRNVALKVLSGTLGLSSRAIQRFKREAEAAARLHHTNIVPVYAIGEQNGVHFYAMELIDGPSLDRVLHQAEQANAHTVSLLVNPSSPAASTETQVIEAALTPSSVKNSSGITSSGSTIEEFDHIASLMAEVANALDYAHEQGVVHRDIKPSNLLLGPNGKLSINDFGLARVLEAPNMTATGEMLGTPAYMSPEQITAGRTPLDHRTDIYSLGATLYEMLTLKPLFTGERRDQLLAQILHKDPIPLRKINKRIPIDLETICLKAIDKDPDKRYQTCGQFAKDLERYVDRFEISARRVGPVGKTIKWIRRQPVIAIGGLSVILALGLATGFAFKLYKSEQARLTSEAKAASDLAKLTRDNAIDRATLAATSGDLLQADAAILEAEQAGATPAEIRMLRGQVAFFSGNFQTALIDLQVAEELSPESAAPKGLLALTYLHTGDRSRYGLKLEELGPIVPITNQDLLFKAYAYYWTRPDISLDLLGQRRESLLSPLTRAILADIRMARAEQQADLELAELALQDIAAAKQFLPNNPVVLAISLWLNSVSSNLFAKAGLTDQCRLAIERGNSDFEALVPWRRLPYPSFSMWEFRSRQGRASEMIDLLKEATDSSSSPLAGLRYANVLCRQRKFTEARELIARFDTSKLDGGWLKAYIAAELKPNELSDALSILEKEYSTNTIVNSAFQIDTPQEYVRRALLMLGETERAMELYRAEVSRRSVVTIVAFEDWCLDFGAGLIEEDEFIRISEEDGPWALSHCYALAGLRHLSRGKRSEALHRFRDFKNTAIYGEPQLDIIYTFLDLMEQDPTWPPWIPAGEETTVVGNSAAESEAGE